MSIVIAVDGVAASGKGTIARAVAAHYGFAYLDTGSLYRRVAEAVLRSGGDCADEPAAIAAAEALDHAVPDAALRTAAVGQGASVVAAHPRVRAALLGLQRDFAARPPGGAPGAVLDGRDIGTVVCPDAPAKLFVTARLDVRARRRWSELHAQGSPLTPEQVAAEIAARDSRDSGRNTAPLRAAPDAVLLDTSDLTIEAAIAAAQVAVRVRIGR